jgi:hypothetical protein
MVLVCRKTDVVSNGYGNMALKLQLRETEEKDLKTS